VHVGLTDCVSTVLKEWLTAMLRQLGIYFIRMVFF
jgi:predicted thioredoxin/glutaredoxin